MKRIGVIADTHGLLRPEVAGVFTGVDHILHAGDIGGASIVDALRAIAPVTFVLGNNDNATGDDVVRMNVGDLRVLLTHILPRPRKPSASGTESLRRRVADVVVFGHSHLPHNERIDGVLFFNPASAGPRRFDYPVSVGMLEKRDGTWRALHIALDERSKTALGKKMNQLQ